MNKSKVVTMVLLGVVGVSTGIFIFNKDKLVIRGDKEWCTFDGKNTLNCQYVMKLDCGWSYEANFHRHRCYDRREFTHRKPSDFIR